MAYRLLHWGPIVALTIIIVLYLFSLLTVFVWFPPDNAVGIFNLILLCVWLYLILKNFLKAAFLGPGHLPYQWKPENAEDVEFLQYCEPCQGYKAPRAHHCKKCKGCIMKMDHHCPWINNCVGHCNHKSFTLFLFFVVLGCFHAAMMMLFCVIDHLIWIRGRLLLEVNPSANIPMSHFIMFCLFFGIGLSLGVTIAVAILLFYQARNIFRNETGIESWIVEKATARNRYDGEVFVYPYDLGLTENISQVLTWSHDYVGDGITWPVFEGCGKYDLTVEQLEQKDIKRDRTLIYKVIKPYTGTWFPLKFGFRVFCDIPCSDEVRVPIKVGNVFHATRFKKYWVYGEKQEDRQKAKNKTFTLGQEHRLKGWIPRCCVEELVEEGITLIKKTS